MTPAEIAEKIRTAAQLPSDSKGVFDQIKDQGLAVVLLVVLGVVMWRLATWVRPKADAVLNGLLENNARVPVLIETQRVQNEAVLATLSSIQESAKVQAVLLSQVADRLSDNVDGTKLVATQMAALAERMTDLVERLPRS